MKPLHDKKHTPAKRFLSLLCVLALCLGLLPVTALAAGDAPDTLWVGQTQITKSGYWKTNADGTLTADGASESNYNVYYDGSGTLTLNNATIQGGDNVSRQDPQDYGIYASSTTSQSVSLTINLIGTNTVKGVGGIYIISDENSSLVIQSDTNGSLEANGSGWNGITISSDSSNASLTINNASVVANSETQGSHGVGINSRSSTELSLTVNGGSLTAKGTFGIYYSSDYGTNPSTSLTVSDSALIKALPSIYASVASVPTPKADNESGGIVFDGKSGTVYGNVELQDDLTINEGESLTIPEGSTLTTKGNLTNNGTIVNKGTLNGDLTGGTGTVVNAPAITTDSLPEGTVNQPYTATLTATGNNIAWSVSGDLPAGLTLDTSTGTISGTPTTVGTSTLTVKATNSAGDASKQFSLTINAVPVTSVSLNKDALSLTVGGNETLTATVEPETATDKTVTWESSDSDVATVDQSGNVKAVASGTATINVTANDGSGQKASCTVTVTQPVTGVTLDQTELALYTGGSATLTATVEPSDAANQNVTWQSDNANVATVENGKVTAVSAGTATISVTTQDGGKTDTCTVKVTDPVYDMTTDTTALNFGSAYTGYTQPAAKTVTVKNTGNQPVTLNQPSSTDNFVVGNLTDTELVAGETATFKVQPKAGLSVGTYSDTITVSGSENVIVTIPASFTVKSRPSYNPPTVSEETTDAIQAADPGETVTVDLSHGSTKLDKEVFETLAGKDVTLVVDLGDDVSWTVNGSDIPEDADFTDIDMGVTMNSDGIPVDVVNAITGERSSVQITLAHDGAFGFTMTLTAPLGKETAGYWANLYHYDEDAEALNFEAAAKIDEDGSVTIPFSHASQYAIVIDDHSHATVDVSDLFIDITPDAWYKDAVQYAYDNGLMTGVSADAFAPEATTTRAMIVSILARLEGVTTAEAAGFADVDDNDWYATAVNWAANVGVVNGYEDNTFKPNTAITREQLAAILMNYAAYKGYDVSNRADLATYTDQPSTWAQEAMQWAVAEKLITGVTNDELQPQGNATRAQVAAILQRFLDK